MKGEEHTKKFAHPKVVKVLPGMEAAHCHKPSMVISDEEKHVPALRRLKNKPDLKIRKVSFESSDSTNESQHNEEQAPLSPCSKLNRDLASDYGV